MSQNVFADEWRECLRAHYQHVIRVQDKVTEPSLTVVMHEAGFSDADLRALRLQATLRAEDVGEDFVPDMAILTPPQPLPASGEGLPNGLTPPLCTVRSLPVGRRGGRGVRLSESPIFIIMELTNLSFDNWIRYVFDHPVDHLMPEWYWDMNRDSWDELKSPATTVDYMTRLFDHLLDSLAPYTDAQINQGLWFMVNNACSEHMFALMETSILHKTPPATLQNRVACIDAMTTLFRTLFAPRCTPTLGHLSEGGNPLNSVCYMWWDIMPFSGHYEDTSIIESWELEPKRKAEIIAWHQSQNTPESRALEQAMLRVMTHTLELDSDACRESALHGLGHWSLYFGEYVRGVIDDWLSRHSDIRPELKKYAQRARHGHIQ